MKAADLHNRRYASSYSSATRVGCIRQVRRLPLELARANFPGPARPTGVANSLRSWGISAIMRGDASTSPRIHVRGSDQPFQQMESRSIVPLHLYLKCVSATPSPEGHAKGLQEL